jgi:hypothetical protein
LIIYVQTLLGGVVDSVSQIGTIFGIVILTTNISLASGLSGAAKQTAKLFEKPKVNSGAFSGEMESAAGSALKKDSEIIRFGEAGKVTAQKSFAEIDKATWTMKVKVRNAKGDIMDFSNVDIKRFIHKSASAGREEIKNVEAFVDPVTSNVSLKITGSKVSSSGQNINFTKVIEARETGASGTRHFYDFFLKSSLEENPVTKQSVAVTMTGPNRIEASIDGGKPIVIRPELKENADIKLHTVRADLENRTIRIEQLRETGDTANVTKTYEFNNKEAFGDRVVPKLKSQQADAYRSIPSAAADVIKGSEAASEIHSVHNLNINTKAATGQH